MFFFDRERVILTLPPLGHRGFVDIFEAWVVCRLGSFGINISDIVWDTLCLEKMQSLHKGLFLGGCVQAALLIFTPALIPFCYDSAENRENPARNRKALETEP